MRTEGLDPVHSILAHHERTKHHPRRYAAAPEGMDWDNEPDPFRRYRGARLLPLEQPGGAERPSYDALYARRGAEVRPVDRSSIAALFFYSLALSAWKEYRGARWSLRVNPSSGDLHPTEGYLISAAVPGLLDRPAVCHYAPREHALELRLELDAESWTALSRGLPDSALLIGLTSIDWRESWKYGERAFRYCQLDIGHAIAAVALSAAALGWETRVLETLTDADVARLLGTHRQQGIEAEHAECLLAVFPRSRDGFGSKGQRGYRPDAEWFERIAGAAWRGRRNRLSTEHRRWPTIDAARRATTKTTMPRSGLWSPAARASISVEDRGSPALEIVRQRRSILALDGRAAVARGDFYRMLGRTLRDCSNRPLAALPWQPALHLLLFVHRVDGLAPGLYLLVRDTEQHELLRSTITTPFEWRRPPRCPEELELYLLRRGDFQEVARISSCHQQIASDGAFAAAMLAQFQPRLERWGAWFYRRLHWEAGAVGHLLYLEAETAGVGGTGIGCFFDDVTHSILGLEPERRRFQTLYHFTVGGRVEDARLTSLPAYPAPDER